MRSAVRFALTSITLFAIVTTQSAGGGLCHKPLQRKIIEITFKNKRISSSATTVSDGDTLRLCNLDGFFHKPFSISKPNTFSVTIKQGECKAITARNPTGKATRLAIFDDLHAYEKLVITVLPTEGDTTEPMGSSDDSGEIWRKALGRWKNQKGTLVLDIVEADGGVEGRVVKPPPNWPKNITPGTAYLRSRRINGNTIDALIRTFPQGDDCPRLAKQEKFEPSSIEIDPSGDRLTVYQTSRYYSASACQWSDKTFEENITWLRVK